MDYVYRLLGVRQDEATPPASLAPPETEEPPVPENMNRFFRLATIIAVSLPLTSQESISGDLNGTSLSESISNMEPDTEVVFAITVHKNNKELLDRLKNTICEYRKATLEAMKRQSEINCCICFHDKEVSGELACGHKFCFECINKIVFESNRNNCPLCRAPFIN
jgi:hypothetical protein